MAIIGISGKIGTGKDTVGKIIQYLSYCNQFSTISYSTWELLEHKYSSQNWKIVKFADALKDIVCILTGCTREQLEDIDFKNSKLPDEWNKPEGVGICDIMMNLLYQEVFTYRMLLQYLGTDLLRKQLHEDVWVNALFSKYKPKICSGSTHCALAGKPEISCNLCPEYPNWIITDVRFPNEAEAIKDRKGIIIRVNRANTEIKKEAIKTYKNIYGNLSGYRYNEHPSETALDNYNFDYIIDNNDTIEELIKKVKEILIKEKII